jgi:hypothetical protein
MDKYHNINNIYYYINLLTNQVENFGLQRKSYDSNFD